MYMTKTIVSNLGKSILENTKMNHDHYMVHISILNLLVSSLAVWHLGLGQKPSHFIKTDRIDDNFFVYILLGFCSVLYYLFKVTRLLRCIFFNELFD